MADIMLHTSSVNQVTCVSNVFIDDFMKDANGEYVKIYLYLLRCLGRDDYDFSISEVADRLEHTEKDVMRAFTYWEKVGLLRLEYTSENELSGICLVDVSGQAQALQPVSGPAVQPVAFTVPTAAMPAVGVPVTSTRAYPMKPIYSAEELSRFSSQADIQEIIFATEHYLGRPLSSSDTNSILYWYDSLHMSFELIEYLVETCIDNGHSSFHYMDTVARNWTDDGITTVAEAKACSKVHNNSVYSIMKAMGISGRNLIASELTYIDKWTLTYNFDIDIICEACKRTVLNTNKPSFKYADSILERWSKAGVTSLADINALDQQFIASSAMKVQSAKTISVRTDNSRNNKFNNFDQRFDDYADLEASLLRK